MTENKELLTRRFFSVPQFKPFKKDHKSNFFKP